MTSARLPESCDASRAKLLNEARQALASSAVSVEFAPGALARVGELAAACGARRALLVADPAMRAPGFLATALDALAHAGVSVCLSEDVAPNPSTRTVAAVIDRLAGEAADFIVALGGGSAMDCAKGANLLLTNGGALQDYWGTDRATRPLLPSILIPTTAGTGSEAQSFALISDAQTHQKMACGDRRRLGAGGLRPRVTILDPHLTRTQPPGVAAAAGIDALSHAVETAGCTLRSDASRTFSRLAWKLLSGSFERALRDPSDDDARAAMLLGAHLGGAAIEASMLGAAHACANPLTARFEVTHGIAVGLMLPHVIRYNTADGANPFADLADDPARLLATLAELLEVGRLPHRLRDLSIPPEALPALAHEAAGQWTARFNPRTVSADDLLAIYREAW